MFKIDFTFLCTITSHNEAKVGKTPDVHQVGIAWVPLNEITDYNVNFIMGEPKRSILSQWISNHENVKTPTVIAG
ncbi:hypothetical protein GC093_16325 [Paenibacillus sp. LMG 31456]|uniref:NUDIX hydrolase n=1 Tax=Paenibacillus foliorum TaxID=2654974 RepID=A0A972GQ36_9BACL|nr:hypothetical protein [Paenibacillus foliorum]NOU94774.1 hypothetical protein [Paenibacillus foliorum]